MPLHDEYRRLGVDARQKGRAFTEDRVLRRQRLRRLALIYVLWIAATSGLAWAFVALGWWLAEAVFR